MKIENLKVGMVIKNYKELCELLGIKVSAGNTKKAQIKEIERYAKLHKDKYSITIDEIYSVPIEKKDNRQYNGNSKYKDLTLYNPDKCNRIADLHGYNIKELGTNSSKVLSWLCERCDDIFKKSIDSVFSNKKVLCTRCSLSNGSRVIYDILTEYNVDFEQEFYFEDLKVIRPLRFDYAVFYENKLNCLIEYDGEYHDFHEKIIKHDEMKNSYCLENGIELIRIDCNYKELTRLLVLNKVAQLQPDNIAVINERNIEYEKLKGKASKLNDRLEVYRNVLECIAPSNEYFTENKDM